MQLSRRVIGVIAVALLAGCSAASEPSKSLDNDASTGDVGGTSSTGGAVGMTGGVTSTGGTPSTGGAMITGGTPSTGGAMITGGAPSTGGMMITGGAPSTGGVTNTGGTLSTGGEIGTGGTLSTGGAGGTGGTGGTSSGGTGGSGGTPPAGEKFVGNITTNGQVRSDFATYWNQITPENEGKWGSVEGTRDQMNWGGLDAAYNYAKDHGFPFKEHNFVWGSQQPGWIGGLSQSEQRAEVEEWIRLYCERYPDTNLIDVVNEPPPHTTPVYTAALGGAGTSGYDWIVQAFQWARQYCPNAILILNDYNTIEYSGDNSHFIDIVNKIRAAGAPIDAIGAQAHAAYGLSTSTVQGFLQNLEATGLPVYITEYDINLQDDTQQKNVMESQFTMFWNDPNISGITLWGYIEGSTWLPYTGLMSSSGTQRPAMTWLMSFLGR